MISKRRHGSVPAARRSAPGATVARCERFALWVRRTVNLARLTVAVILAVVSSACSGDSSSSEAAKSRSGDLIARTTPSGVTINAVQSSRSCLVELSTVLRSKGRERRLISHALDRSTEPIALADKSPEAVIVRASPAIETVEWRSGAVVLDRMSPADGWAVLAVPVRDLNPQVDAELRSTTIVGITSGGERLEIGADQSPMAPDVSSCGA